MPSRAASARRARTACVAASDEWIVVRRLHVDGQARPAAAVLEPGMRLEDG